MYPVTIGTFYNMSFVTRWKILRRNQSQVKCVQSAFVCQFYTVSNPHATHFLTIHCCVCVFEVIWPFYYKEPRFRVGGSFTILVSESWKNSRSLAHEEESTSLSA